MLIPIFAVQKHYCMSKKSEERKMRGKKINLIASCILGMILIADILVFFIAFAYGKIKIATYAFLAIFVIVPPLTGLAVRNLDFSSSSLPWFVD